MRERPDLIVRDDLLLLLGRHLALEPRLGRLKLRALGFQRLDLLAKRRHRGAALREGIDEQRQLRLDAGELRADTLEVLLELRQGLAGELVRALGERADALGVEMELLHELQHGAVQRLGRDVLPRTGAAHRLLGGAALVVRVVVAALALAGPGRHRVPAEAAAQEALEQVHVVARLTLVAALAPVVLVHHRLDDLVRLPRTDRLPLAVEELIAMLLPAGVDDIAEHPAEDGLRVERAPRRPVAALPELLDERIDTLALQIEGVRRADVSGEGLVDRVELALHPVADRRRAEGKPLLGAPRHLLLDARGRHLALVLSERDQHGHVEAASGRREIDLLVPRDDLNAVPFQDLDELQEVHHASGDAVDLVDHDHIDQARSDQFEQLLVGGALRVLGALAVALPVLLAFDELFRDEPVQARLTLGVDELHEEVALRVERAVLLLRLLVRRDAHVERDVDGAGAYRVAGVA